MCVCVCVCVCDVCVCVCVCVCVYRRVATDEDMAAKVGRRMVVRVRPSARMPLIAARVPAAVKTSLRKQLEAGLLPLRAVLTAAAVAFAPFVSGKRLIDTRTVNDGDAIERKGGGVTAAIEVCLAPFRLAVACVVTVCWCVALCVALTA